VISRWGAIPPGSFLGVRGRNVSLGVLSFVPVLLETVYWCRGLHESSDTHSVMCGKGRVHGSGSSGTAISVSFHTVASLALTSCLHVQQYIPVKSTHVPGLSLVCSNS
jgi:hypothetical protein